MSRPPSPQQQPPPAGAVSAVNLKLPPFWPSNPQVWFAQVEAQFKTRSITSQRTKYDHVVASLSPEVATDVRDLILKPPDANPYDELKMVMIKRTTESEQRRLQQLFSSEELGDRKPSQLLRRLQQLLGDKVIDASFLRELFLQRLPPNVRMVLASTPETTTIDDIATLADHIMDVSAPSISTVAATQLSTDVDHLRAEIASLRELVSSLSPQIKRRKPQSPRHRCSPSPAPPRTSDDLCWYHARFGQAAKKCRSPCSWEENSQARR